MIDKDSYSVFIVTPDSLRVEITGCVAALTLTESASQLAQCARMSLLASMLDSADLMRHIRLCSRIIVAYGGETVFSGQVWQWRFICEPARMLDIAAYDDLIYAQRGKDVAFFPAGLSTKDIVARICGKWNIPLSYEWSGISHPRTALRAQSIAEQIISVLDAAAKRNGEYVASMIDRTLRIRAAGSGKSAHSISGGDSLRLEHSLSLDNLATRVIITGKELASGQTPVRATLDADLSFGVVQEIVSSQSDSLEDARAEAMEILRARARPDEYADLSVPDIPLLRKGDAVSVSAASLSGSYIVRSITHDALARTMSLRLSGLADAPSVCTDDYPTLRYGDKGEYVSAMQALLLERGQRLERFGADGLFFAETLAAVRAFQAERGLAVDGICGPLTWGALLA